MSYCNLPGNLNWNLPYWILACGLVRVYVASTVPHSWIIKFALVQVFKYLFYNSKVVYSKEQNAVFLSFLAPQFWRHIIQRMCHFILCYWSNGFLTVSEPIQGRVNVVAKTTCYSGTNWKATHIFASGVIRGLFSVSYFSSRLSVQLRIFISY